MAFVATRPAPSDGSRTITVHDNQPGEGGTHDGTSGESLAVGTLRLRAAPRSRQRVVWRDDVVDNEGAGKKSSKSMCILVSLLMHTAHTICLSLLYIPQAEEV